jgi:dipeptidyl aminopeptidase/acylaminoacyl peptidase
VTPAHGEPVAEPAAAAPFGTWPSPISAGMLAEAGVSLSEVHLSGESTLWIEGRPSDGGRRVIVRAAPYSEPSDVTPEGFSVRTKVHEYGGGSFWTSGEAVFFSNFADQRLYRQDHAEAAPVPITPEAGGRIRYADGRTVPGTELAVCVRERHEADGVSNELVALPLDGSAEPWVVASGHDFYSFPRPSGDGARLAWTCWDHPRMPWDGAELWVAGVDRDLRPADVRLVAGGPSESAQQPVWSPEDELVFVSDRSGWWNLYRDAPHGPVPLAPMEAEFGGPQWVFGLSYFGFLADGRIACAYGGGGRHRFALLDPGSLELLDLDLPFSSAPWDTPQLAVEGHRIAIIAGGPATPDAVVTLDFTSRSVDVLKESTTLAVDPAYISEPRHIEFPTEGDRTAYAYVYAPKNPRARGPADERPPLIVISHGGPTAASSAELDLETQFWTTRGFAVVDVNYGGSTGYGRRYRERLKGAWGVVDVVDCIAAARHLAETGVVDGDRMAIRGGSAGGFTTLCALTFHAGVFAAGGSYYGVADAESLARDTHKFESRYLDGLIGLYPEEARLYRDRSPIHATHLLAAPLIVFQGLEDEVVPPSQAEALVAALESKGLTYAYLAFEGEQHGFRRAETIRRSLEAELSFYGSVFGFKPADQLERIEIHNPP